jgi:ATP-dependent RNA helicase DDX42
MLCFCVCNCKQAAAAKHRTIDPLAPVDHSLVEYDDFAKDFYNEHPTIAAMSEQQVR